MENPKTIYCPRCNRKVGTWDGKSTINLISRCNKCNKKILYDIKNDKTIVKPLPKRTTASGMTFI